MQCSRCSGIQTKTTCAGTVCTHDASKYGFTLQAQYPLPGLKMGHFLSYTASSWHTCQSLEAYQAIGAQLQCPICWNTRICQGSCPYNGAVPTASNLYTGYRSATPAFQAGSSCHAPAFCHVIITIDMLDSEALGPFAHGASVFALVFTVIHMFASEALGPC